MLHVECGSNGSRELFASAFSCDEKVNLLTLKLLQLGSGTANAENKARGISYFKEALFWNSKIVRCSPWIEVAFDEPIATEAGIIVSYPSGYKRTVIVLV